MKAAITREIDYLYNNIDTFDSTYVEKVEGFYNDLKDKHYQLELCKLSYLLGQIYLDSGKYIDAIKKLDETVDLSENVGNFDLKTNALALLGTVYSRQHLSMYALYFRLEVERRLFSVVLTEEQEKTLLIQYNNIGMNYIELEMYTKAEEYLKLALKAEDHPLIDDEKFIEILGSLVIFYSRVSRFDDAKEYINKIGEVIKRNKDNDGIEYIAKTAIAEYNYRVGNVREAHELFKDCLNYSISRFGTIEDVDMIDTWTKMLRDYKMHFELEGITDLLKKFSSEIEFDFELSVLENEYLVAKQKNQLQRALKKLEKYTELKDYKAGLQQELIFENLDRIVHLQRSYKNERTSIDKDDLTECYNRKFLKKVFKTYQDKDSLVSMIILDIDCFKEYNDNYGHVKGDEVLKTISSILIEHAEANHSYAIRYGGDEFLIFAPEFDLKQAEELAMKIFDEVRARNLVHYHSYVTDRLSITMGVSEFKLGPNTKLGTCIAGADVQLYKGKEAGRNCVFSNDVKVVR